jgi:flagellar hook assembly protein FlgD
MASVVRDRVLEAGTQRVLWSGRTLNGTPAPNGTYLIEVTATTGDGAQARALGQVRVSR